MGLVWIWVCGGLDFGVGTSCGVNLSALSL